VGWVSDYSETKARAWFYDRGVHGRSRALSAILSGIFHFWNVSNFRQSTLEKSNNGDFQSRTKAYPQDKFF